MHEEGAEDGLIFANGQGARKVKSMPDRVKELRETAVMMGRVGQRSQGAPCLNI